jgi:hypothetical protein
MIKTKTCHPLFGIHPLPFMANVPDFRSAERPHVIISTRWCLKLGLAGGWSDPRGILDALWIIMVSNK